VTGHAHATKTAAMPESCLADARQQGRGSSWALGFAGGGPGRPPVASGAAEWVDPKDRRKGIICRETLYFGARPLRPEKPFFRKKQKRTLGGGEVEGLRYQPPFDPAWQELHAMARRSLRTRAYLTLKAWFLEFQGDTESATVCARGQ